MYAPTDRPNACSTPHGLESDMQSNRDNEREQLPTIGR